jgi:hypothetical protein
MIGSQSCSRSSLDSPRRVVDAIARSLETSVDALYEQAGLARHPARSRRRWLIPRSSSSWGLGSWFEVLASAE